MFSRLQGNPSIGPNVDPRTGPEPFEWLAEQFRRGDAGLQHRMTAILGDFLDELPDSTRWPERARWALLDVIQDCGESLVDRIFRLVRQQTFLKAAGLGPQAHAGLLKCLISNGHHATPEFWLRQADVLGPEYGALIVSGLIDHGLDLAMSQLPRQCAQEPSRTLVRWLFPNLQDRFGTVAVLASLDHIRDQLPAETYEVFRSDLLPTKVEPKPTKPKRLGPPRFAIVRGTSESPLSVDEVDRLSARLEAWLMDWLVQCAGVSRDDIAPERPFAGHGLDSLDLSLELKDWLQVPVTAVIAWNCQTPLALARYLAEEVGGIRAAQEAAEAKPDEDTSALLDTSRKVLAIAGTSGTSRFKIA